MTGKLFLHSGYGGENSFEFLPDEIYQSISARDLRIIRTESLVLSGIFPRLAEFTLTVYGNFTVKGKSYTSYSIPLPRHMLTGNVGYHMPCFQIANNTWSEYHSNIWDYTNYGGSYDSFVSLIKGLSGTVTKVCITPPAGYRFVTLQSSGCNDFVVINCRRGYNDYYYDVSQLSMSSDGTQLESNVSWSCSSDSNAPTLALSAIWRDIPGYVCLEPENMSPNVFISSPLVAPESIISPAVNFPDSITLTIEIKGNYIDSNEVINESYNAVFGKIGSGYQYEYLGLTSSAEYWVDRSFSYISGSDRPMNGTCKISIQQTGYRLVELDSSRSEIQFRIYKPGSSTYDTSGVGVNGLPTTQTLSNCKRLIVWCPSYDHGAKPTISLEVA